LSGTAEETPTNADHGFSRELERLAFVALAGSNSGRHDPALPVAHDTNADVGHSSAIRRKATTRVGCPV
jgi:hypothetical protein